LVQRINVLGTGISAITPRTALESMLGWIEAGQRHYVCVCAVHTVMECQQDPELQAMVNRAALAVPDGMPLVWLAHLDGQRHVRRVYGPDLMLSFCQVAADKGYSSYLLGGAPGQPEALARKLADHFPGLTILSTHATPNRPLAPDENEAVIEEINRIDPDVVWVGMGTRFQERWMAENRDRLKARVLVGVGAAFDMHSNKVHQAPAWMQGAGLEWLFRLVQEPRRLWRRYLVGNPLFVLKVAGQRLGLRTYAMTGQAPKPAPGNIPGTLTTGQPTAELLSVPTKS
jgi:N-acetylglucosaminyldiphosphoundecaprenol N-acetyl-beta-D-mannosaminyltransferase